MIEAKAPRRKSQTAPITDAYRQEVLEDFRICCLSREASVIARKEVLTGNFPWLQLLLVFGSSCVYAVAALAVAVEAFKRESVLFRS